MALDRFIYYIENCGDDEYAIVIATSKEEAIKMAFPYVNPKWPFAVQMYGRVKVTIRTGRSRIIEEGHFNYSAFPKEKHVPSIEAKKQFLKKNNYKNLLMSAIK